MADVKLLNESMETIAMVNSDSFKGNYKNLQIVFYCCNIDVDKIKLVVCNLFKEDIYKGRIIAQVLCQWRVLLSIVNSQHL